jgi:phosphoglycolate phosphatase (TIGR01487 family)
VTYKAFVLDIDGTICDYDGLLSLKAVHSIRWLRNLGYEVILASGRGPWDTYYLGVFIGCTRVAVCENGGVVMTSPTELKLFSDKSKSLEAYDLLSKKIDNVMVKPVSARLTEVVLLRTFDVAEGQNILDQAGIPVVINDSKFAFHLTRRGVDKGKGLKEAMDYLKIPLEDAIVIGDSETDLPMFEKAGYSIAVGNASDRVKTKATHYCVAPMGDGVVEAIQFAFQAILQQRVFKRGGIN